MGKIIGLIICTMAVVLCSAHCEAGQVTMASYDFDGDYIDEIIRTDEEKGSTVIKIYTRIDGSFFYKPLKEFTVRGRLVQIPEIADVNSDGIKDYYFATGVSMGVIYYDFAQRTFVRTNNFNFDAARTAEIIEDKEFPLEANDIIYIPPMEKHMMINRTDKEFRYLEFHIPLPDMSDSVEVK